MQIQQIGVDISLDPEPQTVLVDDPAWISFHHCGQWTLTEEGLVAYGGLDPGIDAIALVNYGSWGGLFSGGGTQQLEVDLSSGSAPIYAALKVEDVLYDLSITDPDTGVPGGERTYWYDANNFEGQIIAREIHTRFPIIEVPVIDSEPLPCAK